MFLHRWSRKTYALIQEGQICHDCGVWFKKPHGKPVICQSCARWRLNGGKKIDFPIAVHPEIDVDDLSPAEKFRILGHSGEKHYDNKKVK